MELTIGLNLISTLIAITLLLRGVLYVYNETIIYFKFFDEIKIGVEIGAMLACFMLATAAGIEITSEIQLVYPIATKLVIYSFSALALIFMAPYVITEWWFAFEWRIAPVVYFFGLALPGLIILINQLHDIVRSIY